MPLPCTRSQLARAAVVGALLIAFATAAPAVDGERLIVCLGDSLTEGYGLAPERAFPSLVERMLRERGHSVRVANAGISGSTSASAVSQLRWQLRSRPEIVVIALGGNDGLRGVDVEATRANLSLTSFKCFARSCARCSPSCGRRVRRHWGVPAALPRSRLSAHCSILGPSTVRPSRTSVSEMRREAKYESVRTV